MKRYKVNTTALCAWLGVCSVTWLVLAVVARVVIYHTVQSARLCFLAALAPWLLWAAGYGLREVWRLGAPVTKKLDHERLPERDLRE